MPAPVPSAPLPWTVRLAVPSRPEPRPGLSSVLSRITGGLPHAIPLDGRRVLGLVAPTGLARFWTTVPRDAMAGEAGEDSPEAPPFRLLLRGEGGALLGVAPLALGPVRLVGASAEPVPSIRLRITNWRVHAGSLVGPGDFGSFLAFDWAPWGAAAGAFAAPTARPAVRRRLALDRTDDLARAEAEVAAAVGPEASTGSGAVRFRGYGRSVADD